MADLADPLSDLPPNPGRHLRHEASSTDSLFFSPTSASGRGILWRRPEFCSTHGQEAKPAETWSFAHSPDPFTDKAVLDLRYLNEKEAGESGFLKRTPDGNGFALGNGKPVRLWAVGSDVYHRGSPEEMARHARFLAKIGVNMVRIHTQLSPNKKDSQLNDVDAKQIDRIWQFVAALKKQGIYVTISPYWATERDVTRWGIDGYTGKTDLWGLLFFDEKLQDGYKAWVKALYEPKNPYTGIPLGPGPGSRHHPGPERGQPALLDHAGHQAAPNSNASARSSANGWSKKYGSLAKAKEAWGDAKHDKDDWAKGKVGIHIVWQMTQPHKGGMAKRLHDQTPFLRRDAAPLLRGHRRFLSQAARLQAAAQRLQLGDGRPHQAQRRGALDLRRSGRHCRQQVHRRRAYRATTMAGGSIPAIISPTNRA